jgi:tellurite resistance protein TerC
MELVHKITATLGLDRMPRLRKFVIAVIGGTILLLGFVLIVLPGPAVLVIPIGLLILATEFAWARHLVRRGKLAFGKARRWKWREAFSTRREE